jgi:two-component system sensor histidine kinase TtrS
VANGACDFAIRVDSRLEITGVIPFRQKTPPQLTGLSLSEFVANSSCESVVETIQESVSTSDPRLVQFYAINESARPCSYVARIEPASSRSRRRDLTLYLTNNDVERAHADELAHLREQLDRAARLSLLGNIATEFAYQLTLPLQAVENYLYTLTRRLKRFQPHESMLPCAENIALSLDHARGIIDGLREFVTNRQMKPADTELSRQVRTALTMVSAQAERAGVRITIDDPHLWIEGQESPMVFVDPVQTTHVMISLIVNAIEACTIAKTDRPEITITLEPDENPAMVMVKVSDNGPGIPPGQLERIFDRFYSTRTEAFGVGLAICREIIESQGGRIYARNNAKRGSTFFFTLPLSSNPDRAEDDLSDDTT